MANPNRDPRGNAGLYAAFVLGALVIIGLFAWAALDTSGQRTAQTETQQSAPAPSPPPAQ